MKKKLFLLVVLITCHVNSQITIQDCGNSYSAGMHAALHKNSIINYGGYDFQRKFTAGFNIILQNQPSIDKNGKPIIAKGHIEKIRDKIWFDNSYPSNRNINTGEYLNGYGRDIHPHSFDSFKKNTNLGINNYAYYRELDTSQLFHPNEISLFLGGGNNFPSNEIFRKIRYTVYIYVKQEYAHLYPGGINNRIYQLGIGDTDTYGNKYTENVWSVSVDIDKDGILNQNDNCPDNYNPNQEDSDNDGVGNVCDNCPNISNTNQADIDKDGLGNICDNDIDGDGITNNIDNCPINYNPNQEDIDNDGVGDLCDNDYDNDGVTNDKDNCPYEPNANQADADGDGLGDVCDSVLNKPNLTLSEVKVEVGSKTYTVNSAKTETPLFKSGENHTFSITIKNNDAGYAESSNYKILVSEENKYPDFGNKPVHEFRIRNIGSIKCNSEKSDTFATYIYNNISTLNLIDNKTYYMFFDIDYTKSVDESNESISDNVKYIPFKYTKPTTGKIAYLNTKNGLIHIPLANLNIELIDNSDIHNNVFNGDLEQMPVTSAFISENSFIEESTSLQSNVSINHEPIFDQPIPISSYNIKIYEINGGSLLLNTNVTDGALINASYLQNGVYAIHVDNKYVKKVLINGYERQILSIPTEVQQIFNE